LVNISQEFSQRERNIQLEQQEKAELHADLYQKMAEIVDMHKEAEQKSKDISEKVNQLNALLTQLNESTRFLNRSDKFSDFGEPTNGGIVIFSCTLKNPKSVPKIPAPFLCCFFKSGIG
jgi:ABC-type enterochelin transport system substrate-binding protein